MIKKFNNHPFVSAKEEVCDSQLAEAKRAPTYQLAFLDQDFLLREELRPVRLQLELLMDRSRTSSVPPGQADRLEIVV